MLALRTTGSADGVSSVEDESFCERGNNCKRGRFSKSNERCTYSNIERDLPAGTGFSGKSLP